MACSGYYYGVDMWHTLSIVISLLNCIIDIMSTKNTNCKKQIAIIFVVFNLVYN
jgi:hypothetical protein